MKQQAKNYSIAIMLFLVSICISSKVMAAVPTVLSLQIDYNDGASPALIVTWSEAVETTSVEETKNISMSLYTVKIALLIANSNLKKVHAFSISGGLPPSFLPNLL
jgi:hypothetical protein